MKIYHGQTVSPGLVVGQVSRLERGVGRLLDYSAFRPETERKLLYRAIEVAKAEIEAIAARTDKSESAIFTFQSMILEDDGFLDEIRAHINGGACASEAINRVGHRLAAQLQAMRDNPYMQLRAVDILDACQRVVNVLNDRPRNNLTLDHPVIIAADIIMPSELFSAPKGMILGAVTAEGSPQSHAAIIARALGIPGLIQVGADFLKNCDGHIVALDADQGLCMLDPDSETRSAVISRMCTRQRGDEQIKQLEALPNCTKDGTHFTLMGNCFGPGDIDSAIHSGASGVGLLRSGYLMLGNRVPDEDEQYDFYVRCMQAAQGRPVAVRTFDLGADKTLAAAAGGAQATTLGIRGIRHEMLHPRQFEDQICALMRAGVHGPLQVMFPMIGDIEEWDIAMRMVERCRQKLRERGVPFDSQLPFGIFLSIPAACLTIEDFLAHGCQFITIGSNDLIQFVHAADRNMYTLEQYYRPTSKAVCTLIRMVVEAAQRAGVPVSICGLASQSPANALQYLHMGLRTFSVQPQSIFTIKKAFVEHDLTQPLAEEGAEPQA